MALYGDHARAEVPQHRYVRVTERWSRNPLEWTFRAGPLKGQPKILVDAGCWIWQGGKEKKGYGEVYFPQAEFPRMRMCRKLFGHKASPGWCKARAHQLTYFIKHGNIKDGLELGHSCMRRACCHWDHVSPVTLQQNYSMKFYPPEIPRAAMRDIELRIAKDEPFQTLADEYYMSVWNIRTIAEQMDWARTLQRLTLEVAPPSEYDDTGILVGSEEDDYDSDVPF